MKKKSWATLLTAVALCLTFVAPVVAADPERPFSSRVGGADSYGDVSTCPPGAAVRYVSTGTAVVMHLGLARVDVTHCVWMETSTIGRFSAGTLTLTAANGDTLILSTQGTFQFDTFPPTTSVAHMTWVAAGGTGRFM
jgi:hypothetical protein